MSKPDLVVAWAESASGPGWSNAPLWYLLRHDDGKYSVECTQPSEQTAEMQTLYRTSNIVTAEMTNAVRRRPS